MPTSAPRQLPANVRPLRYRLTLTPDLGKFTFTGEESVDVDVLSATDRIVLNASELQVSQATVKAAGGRPAAARQVLLDEKAQTVACVFERPIAPGQATLDLRFTGTLNDQLHGFYRSQYTDASGATRMMASTQFEATDARRAFPCWDEPAIKATFDLTLVIPSTLTAVSNMPVVSERPAGKGRKAVRFAESLRMSTYLLAFVVGDLASVEQRAADGTLVRVWATRGKEQQGRFALENAVRLLAYFNDYFGVRYPLPKLDHLAIPDFAAGAMENWGAITYRETALLFDPQNSAASTRQRIMEVVSHEMAHMWFGDLVTMAWWDDLWLNESFASWMGDKAVDHLYPEWNMWTQFVYQDTNAGLALDGLRNSHPIEQTVNDPAEIRELFDAISYSKGGAVLRMLEDYLGADVFRQGLRDYMAAHQYGNARTADLWKALEGASGKPVGAIMDSWTRQTGFPVLDARVARGQRPLEARLAQRRFHYDHLLTEGEEDNTLWQVPVSIARAGAPEKTSLLLTARQAETALDGGAASPSRAGALLSGRPASDRAPWVKVNAGQVGFFHVRYEDAEWDRLRGAVERLEVPATDRLGLQSDAYALMRGGYAPATQFLALAGAYRNEVDVSVWSDLSANLRGLETLLYDEPSLPRYRRYAGSLYDEIVRKVGWEPSAGEGHLDALRRALVLGTKGAFGDPTLVAEARSRFQRFLQDPASLHPDLRATVYGLVAQEGDRGLYDTLWDLERKAALHEEKMRLLGALARFQDRSLVRETLERSLSPSEVRIQDTVLVVVSVAGSQAGRGLAWEFMKEKWAELDRRYGTGGFAITRLVGITGAFTSMDRYQDVEAFFEKHPTPSAARTIRQSLERIRLNAVWLERNRQGIADWLGKR